MRHRPSAHGLVSQPKNGASGNLSCGMRWPFASDLSGVFPTVAATALSQSMPPSRYSRSWATASSISRAILLAHDGVELGAAPGAVFQDLNELGPATALPEAPPLAVLALQRAAQGLLPDGDWFFLLLRHCGPNARVWPKVWPKWSRHARTRSNNVWPRLGRPQLQIGFWAVISVPYGNRLNL